MDETWAIQFCNKKKTHIFVLRSGLFYCKTHFVQLIAPKCERCHNPFRYPKYFLFLSSKLILWKVEWCWAFVSACALVLSVFVSVCLFVSKCLYLNMCLGLCSCMIYIQSQSILDFPSFLIFLPGRERRGGSERTNIVNNKFRRAITKLVGQELRGVRSNCNITSPASDVLYVSYFWRNDMESACFFLSGKEEVFCLVINITHLSISFLGWVEI